MAEPRPIRHLYQGILQIGVAFHHLKRNRYRPVCTLLARGSGYLQPFAPACMGVDVDHLLAAAARCLSEVERLGPDNLGRFDWSLIPRIKLAALSAPATVRRSKETSKHRDRKKE
jgi:hypothetical protein